eukprot:7855050-Pyramimonas_sp.AAC.1
MFILYVGKLTNASSNYDDDFDFEGAKALFPVSRRQGKVQSKLPGHYDTVERDANTRDRQPAVTEMSTTLSRVGRQRFRI